MSSIRLIYAANRKVGTMCLDLLLRAGITPVALLLPAAERGDQNAEMMNLLPNVPTYHGKEFAIEELKELKPDILLSVHFPYIIPQEVLNLPAEGTLNLHPAYLPWNRGWHTPTWAIEEQTPFGVTLHWVDEGTDTGDIALQERVEVTPEDTAHSLYQRALDAEVRLFEKAIPLLASHSLPHIPQEGEGTSHRKKDIEDIRKVDLETMDEESLKRRIRALTTNDPNEAAYVEKEGERVMLRLDKNGEVRMNN